MKIIRLTVILCGLLASRALPAQTYSFSNAATHYSVGGVAVDPSGNIYVATYYSGAIVRYAPDGTSQLIAGAGTTGAAVDGVGAAARFGNLRGLTRDAAGNLYVADYTNSTIRKITPGGVVTTIAGVALLRGADDGIGAYARFGNPQGLALDASGNLIVADTGNHTIRRVTPAGVVTTLAGSAGDPGALDGTGGAARFRLPQGVAVDASGNIYVADTGNHAIRQLSPAGVVTTLAGLLDNRGSTDGPGQTARFDSPQGIVVDAAGNAYVADTANYTIRRVTPAGAVATVGGAAGSSGTTNGTGNQARFLTVRHLTIDPAGSLFLADTTGIRLGTPSSQAVITVSPPSQSVAAGTALTLSVTATGAAPLSYQWQKNGTPTPGATLSSLSFSSLQAGDSGTYTVTVSNPLGAVASPGATLTVLAPLPNNDFAGAQVLTGDSGLVEGNNQGATGEAYEPTHQAPSATASSVWYKWTPPQSGRAYFNVTGPGVSPLLAVYTGTALDRLQRVAQGSSPLACGVTAGTTYFIALGSNGPPRAFTLNWHTVPNDDFASAQDLVGNAGSKAGTNAGATGEPGEPNHWSAAGAASSIWYRWTPTQSGTAVIDTIGSAIDTVLAAYRGNDLASLTRLAQDNDTASQPGSSGASRIAFVVTAGTTYHLAVGSAAYRSGPTLLNWRVVALPVIMAHPKETAVVTGATAELTVAVVSFLPVTYQWQRDGAAIAGATSDTLALANLQPTQSGTYVVSVTNAAGTVMSTAVTVTVLTPPANDNFVDAQAITGTTGRVSGSNLNATGEPGEPAHWSQAGANSSVWYRWTAPGNGLAVFDTVGSSFDTVLAIYTGANLASLTRITQDDDRGGVRTSQVNFAVTGGTTYHIAVGGNYASARGSLFLNWQLTLTVAISTPPVSQTVAVGGSATFSVAATGTGLTYQWFRNGTAIPGATNPNLTLGSIQAGTDASYTVTVTSPAGSVTSAPANLVVAAPSVTTLSVRHTRADGDLLWSIAAGAGEIVAVGSFGVILSSSDQGATWTPRDSGTTGWLVTVTYGGGQFVIVGEGGLILTSPNGRVWTRVAASGTPERLNNVLYADGKYVAVGEKGVVVTSVDGRVWTPRATPITTWLHGLAYHAGIKHFATCGEAGVFLYSADAVTWNRLPVPGYTSALQHTVAVDSYADFVAVGEGGVVVSVNRNELLLKDGLPLVTWTAESHPTNTTAHLVGLAQGAGALFAIGEDGKVITATSDRGPWTTVETGTTHLLLAGMFYQDTLFVVGHRELIFQSSPLFGSRLINISTRGQIGTGGSLMISGFVVAGDRPKQVLIRAAGPTLSTAFGLPDALTAPVLTLVDSSGRTVASNTGWGNNANAATIGTVTARVGAFPFAPGSADSALLATLTPGAYTAQISGADATTGVGIVEVYDADALSNEGARAINISTRGLVGTGANRMIAGFVIEGASARRVLIRASGPALAAFGVPGTLAAPRLELYNRGGLLHSSAGAWGLQANADEIRAAAKGVGAFDFADGSEDSALLLTLLPGSWTVQVTGAEETTGVALVEVYMMP